MIVPLQIPGVHKTDCNHVWILLSCIDNDNVCKRRWNNIYRLQGSSRTARFLVVDLLCHPQYTRAFSVAKKNRIQHQSATAAVTKNQEYLRGEFRLY